MPHVDYPQPPQLERMVEIEMALLFLDPLIPQSLSCLLPMKGPLPHPQVPLTLLPHLMGKEQHKARHYYGIPLGTPPPTNQLWFIPDNTTESPTGINEFSTHLQVRYTPPFLWEHDFLMTSELCRMHQLEFPQSMNSYANWLSAFDWHLSTTPPLPHPKRLAQWCTHHDIMSNNAFFGSPPNAPNWQHHRPRSRVRLAPNNSGQQNT